jgi:hypothetical protein
MKLTYRLLGAAALLLAVGGVARADEEPAPSFKKDVKPFLDKYCVSCHNGKRAKSGVDVDGYEALMGNRKMVVAGKADESRLIGFVTGKTRPTMPPRKNGKQPKEDEIKKVKAWIDAGAKDDSDANGSALPAPAPGEAIALDHPPVLAGDRRR